MAGNRAPSVITYFHHSGPGDVLVQNVCVPSDLCVQHTYYCCLNWNMGQAGGGYCGIQCHPNGNCIIFSIWDPPHGSTQDSLKPIFVSAGNSFTERFGGEGEGLKYMNFEYKWKPDHCYTFVVRRWNQNNHTYFGLWVQDATSGKWERMITMDFPLPDIYFETPVACFVEDWHGNGEHARGAKYSNTYKRNKDGDWECLNKGSFYVNQEDACKKWNDNYRIEAIKSGHIFMRTGGETTPTSGNTKGNVAVYFQSCQPDIPSVDIEIINCKPFVVEWKLSDYSIPQFAYTVTINGNESITDIGPECRQASIECSNGDIVEVTIQDVLGREIKLSARTTC